MTDFFDKKPGPDDQEFGYTGSRVEALESGIIIDAGDIPQDVGFKWPVAVTRAVWDECVAWSKDDSERQIVQSERRRLWDLLFQCSYHVRTGRSRTDRLNFSMVRVPRDGISKRPASVKLQIVAHAGDSKEPVLTILRPRIKEN